MWSRNNLGEEPTLRSEVDVGRGVSTLPIRAKGQMLWALALDIDAYLPCLPESSRAEAHANAHAQWGSYIHRQPNHASEQLSSIAPLSCDTFKWLQLQHGIKHEDQSHPSRCDDYRRPAGRQHRPCSCWCRRGPPLHDLDVRLLSDIHGGR